MNLPCFPDDTAKTLIRAVFFVLLLGAVALPARASKADALFIETITVVGVSRASPEIIVSESLLEEGKSYQERQLREAIHRINRLPFVLEASMALRRGSRRGAYELIIDVDETSWFFAGLDLLWIDESESYRSGPPVSTPGPLRDEDLWTEDREAVIAGARHFVGAQGVLFAAVDGESEGFQLGYTQYGLFDSGVFAHLGASRSFSGDRRELVFETGVPLTGNHSLRLSLTHLWSEVEYGFSEGISAGYRSERDETDDEARFEWRFDTRNDTLFTTRGKLLTAGVRWQESVRLWSWENTLPGPIPAAGTRREDEHVLAAEFSLRKFFGVTAHSAASVGFRGAFGEASTTIRAESPALDIWSRIDETFAEGELSLSYLHTLWRPPSSRRRSDLRWETELTAYGTRSQNDVLPDATVYRLTLATGLVLRNRWGVFRASFAYRDYGGDVYAIRRGAAGGPP